MRSSSSESSLFSARLSCTDFRSDFRFDFVPILGPILMTIFLLQRYYKFLIYTNNSSKKFTLFFQALKSPYDDLCILIKYSYIRNVRIKISSI